MMHNLQPFAQHLETGAALSPARWHVMGAFIGLCNN